MRRWAIVLLFASLAGCTPTKVVRLDTGQGRSSVHVPRRDVEPVEVSREQFKQAVAKHTPSVPVVERPLEYAGRLFGVPERSGWFWYEGRSRRLMASEPGNHPNLRLLPEDEKLKRCYLQWCEQSWGGGDCLRLLVDKPFLDGDAKYALAMAIAQSKVLGAMKEELARQVSPQALVATVVGGLTMYALLLALPEPVSRSPSLPRASPSRWPPAQWPWRRATSQMARRARRLCRPAPVARVNGSRWTSPCPRVPGPIKPRGRERPRATPTA